MREKKFSKRLLSLVIISSMVITSFYSPVTALAEESDTLVKGSVGNEENLNAVTGGAITTISGSAVSLPSKATVETTSDNYKVTFSVASQWGSAFQGNIVIENVGDQPIKNWLLKFDMEHEITNIWNAVIGSHQDNSYIINNSGYNKEIAPGQSISIGFQASYTDIIKLPATSDLLYSKQDIELQKEYIFMEMVMM